MRRLRRFSRAWPRVYAQLVATGEIFEISRGESLSPSSYAALVYGFGNTWITWTEAGTRPERAPKEVVP